MRILLATLLLLPVVLDAQPKRKIEGEIAGSYFFGNTEQTVASTRAQFERSDSGFTFNATRALLNYHYPGNIRELQNLIERAVILAQGKEIDIAREVGLLAPNVHVKSRGDIPFILQLIREEMAKREAESKK